MRHSVSVCCCAHRLVLLQTDRRRTVHWVQPRAPLQRTVWTANTTSYSAMPLPSPSLVPPPPPPPPQVPDALTLTFAASPTCLRSTLLCKRTPARTLIHTLADAQCTGTHAQRKTLNTSSDLLCVGRHSGSRLTAANLRRALRPMVVRHNESAEFKRILGTCRSSP